MIPAGRENRFSTTRRVWQGESRPSRRDLEGVRTGREIGLVSVPLVQSKWGRPEGRPHSHRCVVFPKEALGARCLCRWFPTEVDSVRRCHRCSHRHPVPSGGRSGSENPSLVRQAVPRPAFHWPSASNGCVAPAEAFATPPRRQAGRTGRWWLASRSSRTTDLALSRSSLHGDLKDRADSCRHLDRVKKTSNFQAVRLVRSVASAPSR
jgi:hypothetical protein